MRAIEQQWQFTAYKEMGDDEYRELGDSGAPKRKS
jgi:hypothetical protein